MPHCLPTIKRTNRLRQTGLTLVELMTTLAVLAVLAAIAAPSFTSLFERWRTSQAISAFESTLAFARSEAIRRGGGISIIRSTTDDCGGQASNAWQCGWTVSLDSNADGTADANTAPLQIVEALQSTTATVQIEEALQSNTATASGNAGFIAVDRWGVLKLNNTSTNFCLQVKPKGKNISQGSTLYIYPGGRLQQIKGSTNCCKGSTDC